MHHSPLEFSCVTLTSIRIISVTGLCRSNRIHLRSSWFVAALTDLPQPVNVALNSSSFIHLLKWQRGPGTPAGVGYNVSISTETWVSSPFLLPVCNYAVSVLMLSPA